jgi:glycerophosphoryl diester phosphodiesterase
MKRVFAILVLLIAFEASAKSPNEPLMIAHRGGWTKRAVTTSDGTTVKEFVVPENSVAAVGMARRFGYDGIECDVKYTADSVMVLMHDRTMNRTVRNAADYSPLKRPVRVEELTFEELRRDYVLASDDPAMRAPVPTLEEVLAECKKEGMLAVLHSAIPESYALAQKMLGDEGWVAFHSYDRSLAEARKLSNCLILLDPGKQKNQSLDNTVRRLEALGGRCGVSSMKRTLLTEEYCSALSEKGYEIQSSIFKAPHEVQALRNGVTILLTDFAKLPESEKNPLMRLRKRNMRHTQSVVKQWSREVECGALTLEIDFEGTVDLLLNGELRYSLTRNERGIDRLGMRFIESAPSLEVSVANGGIVRSLKANVYRY